MGTKAFLNQWSLWYIKHLIHFVNICNYDIIIKSFRVFSLLVSFIWKGTARGMIWIIKSSVTVKIIFVDLTFRRMAFIDAPPHCWYTSQKSCLNNGEGEQWDFRAFRICVQPETQLAPAECQHRGNVLRFLILQSNLLISPHRTLTNLDSRLERLWKTWKNKIN